MLLIKINYRFSLVNVICNDILCIIFESSFTYRQLLPTTELIHGHMFIEHIYLLFIFILNLFIFRERGREGEREGRHINVWLSLMHPALGTWPATRHVPWLGIELETLWFAGWCSVHWATPARAHLSFRRYLYNSIRFFSVFDFSHVITLQINHFQLKGGSSSIV